MTPFRVCFGSSIERGKFLLGVPIENYDDEKCGTQREVQLSPYYEGENTSNADGLFTMGIIRFIGDLFARKGKSEPNILYIINEEEGKELGFKEW